MNSLLLAVENPLLPSTYDAAWSAMIFIPIILGFIMVIIGLVYLFKLDQPKPLRLALGILLLFLPPLGLFVVMYMYYTGRKTSTV